MTSLYAFSPLTAPSIKFLLPKTPFILQTATFHTLGLSSTSSKWDLKTEVIIRLIRHIISNPKPDPIGKQQRWSLKDPGIKGRLWISKVAFPAPEEDGALLALATAIDALKTGDEAYTTPPVVPVEAEWTGYRAGVDTKAPRPELSEQEHYNKLMNEVTSDVIVLYFHGGALYLMDPCSHRPSCSKLAKLTGGRCLSVRYRLAPKHAFPAALLDAFIAYLSLLAPPPSSFHEPVLAKCIVFSGDSAGGNLSMALLQLILKLHRSSPSGETPKVRFNGRDVEVPLPAGVALNSGWMDLTRCMPSIYSNSHYDYLPAPPSTDEVLHFPKDDLWPTDPPRGDLYCETSMLCHPLVSPLAAKDWRGSCPVYFVYGQECLTDEGKIVARRLVRQGVPVRYFEFEAMPHCFGMIFEHLEGSKKCFASWTTFIKDVVDGKAIQTSGVLVAAKTYKETEFNVAELLSEISDEEVDRRMKEAREKREIGEEGEAKALPRL